MASQRRSRGFKASAVNAFVERRRSMEVGRGRVTGKPPARRRTVAFAALLLLLPTGVPAPASAAAAATFEVQGVFQIGPAHVAIAFTDSVGAAALDPSHYTLTPRAGAPPLAVQGAKVQQNLRTVILATGARLPQSATYGVSVSGVASRSGAPLSAGGPDSFTTVAEVVRGIDEVQSGASSLLGQEVTVIGQVFIRASSSGGAPSAFIQDGSGRGINVFAALGSPVQPAVDTLGTVAEVTGTVAQSFTTVQLTPFTARAIATRAPDLAPQILTVPQASAPQWEGTYVQTTATLTAAPVAYGANDYRYTATGDGTAFTFRVRNAAGVDPAGFTTGDVVTGAGGGAAYPFRYQITVGNFADFRHGPGGADGTPPTLFSASGVGGRDSVTVVFSEPVFAGASVASNYEVFPTADPGRPIAIAAASVSGATVTLTLATALEGGVAHRVRVSNVEDVAGNAIADGSTLDFTAVIPDLTPPTLLSASGTGGQPGLTVTFSEPVFAGASIASNYEVFATATPGSPVAVTAAAPRGAAVALVLAAPLDGGVEYTLRVNGVQDLAGNLIVPNSTVAFTATIPSGFTVLGVFPFGQDFVGVGFSRPVNAAEAVEPSHYAFTPPLAISSIAIQENGQTAILKTASPLPASTTYSLAVSGISSSGGEPLAGGPFSLQTVSGTVTNIAEIQNDLRSFKGQAVVIVGQVFIPVGSRGGTPSGYLQDGSGRGINLFGGSVLAAVNALGNVVKVSGTVDTFNTTIEITRYGAVLLASGQPHLGARVLTARQANSPAWEGTYIQATATLTDPPTASGASNYNYNAADGGAAITFRVGNGLGIDPGGFSVGDRVTGRGAGGAFQTTFQINVGNAADLFRVGAGPQTLATRLTVEAGTLIKRLSQVSIQIDGPTGVHAVCRMFDLQGRLVRVLFDGRLYGSQTLSWDGRDDSFEFVPAGMYVCHLETSDGRGRVSEDRAPIVVGVRLE